LESTPAPTIRAESIEFLHSNKSRPRRSVQDASFAPDHSSADVDLYSLRPAAAGRIAGFRPTKTGPADGRGLRQVRQRMDDAARVHEPAGRPPAEGRGRPVAEGRARVSHRNAEKAHLHGGDLPVLSGAGGEITAREGVEHRPDRRRPRMPG